MTGHLTESEQLFLDQLTGRIKDLLSPDQPKISITTASFTARVQVDWQEKRVVRSFVGSQMGSFRVLGDLARCEAEDMVRVLKAVEPMEGKE